MIFLSLNYLESFIENSGLHFTLYRTTFRTAILQTFFFLFLSSASEGYKRFSAFSVLSGTYADTIISPVWCKASIHILKLQYGFQNKKAPLLCRNVSSGLWFTQSVYLLNSFLLWILPEGIISNFCLPNE